MAQAPRIFAYYPINAWRRRQQLSLNSAASSVRVPNFEAHLAAVNEQRRPGDICGQAGGQENARLRDLVRLAAAPQRNALEVFPQRLQIGKGSLGDTGPDQPGQTAFTRI